MPENAPAVPPVQPNRHPAEALPGTPAEPASDLPVGKTSEAAAAPVAVGRDQVLAAFARSRAQALPQPAPPQPRPQRQAVPAEPEMTEEAVDELIAGWRVGNLAWPKRLLGAEPGHPDCRLSPSVLRRNGLA